MKDIKILIVISKNIITKWPIVSEIPLRIFSMLLQKERTEVIKDWYNNSLQTLGTYSVIRTAKF